MTRSLAGAIGAIIDAGGDVSLSRAGDIACPALLIAGEHDVFVPPPLVAQLAGRIGAAEVLEVPGAGHDLHAGHPDWLAQTLVDCLGKHLAREAHPAGRQTGAI